MQTNPIPTRAHLTNLDKRLLPIRPLLLESDISEVMINGVADIFYERGGVLHRFHGTFGDADELNAAVLAIAQYVGKEVGPSTPILEGHLPDGSRVEAVLPPASPLGPSLAIRRFREETFELADLVDAGALPASLARFLSDQVRDKSNILVAGGTGSGKTTLAAALARQAPAGDRIIVMEDARELQLPMDHVVRLEARPGDDKGRGRITMRDLLRATLRMRPDRILLGEIRGAEALELVQAMTSGHGGCLSTIHASRPTDALARLETLALMSDVELPLEALRPQVASAVDLIVQTRRHGDGRRGVSEVARVEGYRGTHGYELTSLYRSEHP